MVTLKDISKLTNYSISTISKVVNNNIDDLKIDTVEKIRKTLEDYNYTPDLHARNLKTKIGQNIGLIVPLIEQHFFSALTKGMGKYAALKDLGLLLCISEYSPDIEEKFINDLIKRNAYGIIFSRVSDESRVIRTLNNIRLPVVAVDNIIVNEMIPSVTVDNYLAGQIAAEFLYGLSHKKLACVSGPTNNLIARNRLSGFCDYLKSKDILSNNIYIYEGDFDFISGVNAVKNILDRKIEVDGIWAQNDIIALGVLKELSSNNIKVPEDISVMGMDDGFISTIVNPELTTIKQPIDDICKNAVDLIVTIAENKNVFEKIVLKPSLIVRESTRQR